MTMRKYLVWPHYLSTAGVYLGLENTCEDRRAKFQTKKIYKKMEKKLQVTYAYHHLWKQFSRPFILAFLWAKMFWNERLGCPGGTGTLWDTSAGESSLSLSPTNGTDNEKYDTHFFRTLFSISQEHSLFAWKTCELNSVQWKSGKPGSGCFW